MNQFVLDASVTVTWCFPDEKAQKAEIISDRVAAGERARVTAFWPHEVLNALLTGERRKRLTPELTNAFIEELGRMRLDVDNTVTVIVFERIHKLCRKHRLTTYDAAYLELAMRERLPLATVDDELIRAALAEGVELL